MVQAEERDVLKRPEFQPFIRHDQFGINGKKPQSLVTNILLYASAAILMPLRIFFCFSTFLTFMAIAWVIAQIFPREQQPAMLTPFGRFGSKLLVFFLGFHNIKWVYMGKEGSLSEAADCKEVGCIVSNHASWADILILCSVFFNTYVAKSSIQKLPLFGFLSQIMCVIFVNREARLTNGTQAEKGQGATAAIAERMRAYFAAKGKGYRPVVLFPEGTTTNNRYLLPFATGAFVAGVPVQPVVIKYGDGKVSPCWDAITGPRHAFFFLSYPYHTATVYVLPAYHPSAEEAADPKLYASNVRKLMLECGKMQPSNATYKDKLAFYELVNIKKPDSAGAAGDGSNGNGAAAAAASMRGKAE